MRSVCGEEEETEQNHLLQCDGCREFVHMDCYGVGAPPEGRLWLCDVCKLGELICSTPTILIFNAEATLLQGCV